MGAFNMTMISGGFGLNFKVQLNDVGNFLLIKLSMSRVTLYSYHSFSFNMPDSLNNGSVCLMSLNLLLIKIARFWSIKILFIIE